MCKFAHAHVCVFVFDYVCTFASAYVYVYVHAYTGICVQIIYKQQISFKPNLTINKNALYYIHNGI